MFALILKTMFDGQKSTPRLPYQCSFLSNKNEKPKAVYIEAKASQAFQIVSARAIINSPGFRKLYNNEITFVP